jgi:hypothetical protein
MPTIVHTSTFREVWAAADGSEKAIAIPGSIADGDVVILMVKCDTSAGAATLSPDWESYGDDGGELAIWPDSSATFPHDLSTLAVVWRWESGAPGYGLPELEWLLSSTPGDGDQLIGLWVIVRDVGNFRMTTLTGVTGVQSTPTPGVTVTDPLALYSWWLTDFLYTPPPDPDLDDAGLTEEWPTGAVGDDIFATRTVGVVTQEGVGGGSYRALVVYENSTGLSTDVDTDDGWEGILTFSFGHPSDPPIPPPGGFEGWYLGWLAWPDQGGGEG